MDEFLKELTELTLKHKKVLIGYGDHGYSGYIEIRDCPDKLSGKYVNSVDELEWVDE